MLFSSIFKGTSAAWRMSTSRALSHVKRPQGMSPLSQSKDVILRNDSNASSVMFLFSVDQTTGSTFCIFCTNCSLNGFGPVAVDQYPVSVAVTPSIQSGKLRHFPSLDSSSFPDPDYSHIYSTGHVVLSLNRMGSESFPGLLQCDRYLVHPQEPAV